MVAGISPRHLALSPDGKDVRAQVANVSALVVRMASLPVDANVLTMTVMAGGMSFFGRG